MPNTYHHSAFGYRLVSDDQGSPCGVDFGLLNSKDVPLGMARLHAEPVLRGRLLLLCCRNAVCIPSPLLSRPQNSTVVYKSFPAGSRKIDVKQLEEALCFSNEVCHSLTPALHIRCPGACAVLHS